MPGFQAVDRRQTARVPTGARLLYRATGMPDYELCQVMNVTTSAIELLLKRSLAPGTVVTILVRPEGARRVYYRVTGSVKRHEQRGSQWLHVVQASSRQPWSPMFMYDLTYQVFAGSGRRPDSWWTFVYGNADPAAGPGNTRSTPAAGGNGASFPDATADAGRPGPRGEHPAVYRTLARFAPFDELSDLLRRFISSNQTVTRHEAGTTLIERGSQDDISIYLVDGVLELEPFDGKRFSTDAGSREARFPISLLRPHAYTVRAVTDVTVILLSQDTVRKAVHISAAYKNHPGIEVVEEDAPPMEQAGDR